MKLKVTAIAIGLIVLLLAGCPSPSPLAPPAWIQGTWSYSTILSWTFTSDNAVMSSSSSSVDFKALYGSSGAVTDTDTSSQYSIVISSSGVTQTYTFNYVDATHIDYVTGGVTIRLTKS